MQVKAKGAFIALGMVVAMGVVTAPAFASGKPFVETKPATNVGEYTATLNGVVNPNGATTKYYFEYGTTTSYGTKSAEVSAGSGTTNLEESLSGIALNPETTYHFRIVATNSNGTSDGEDATFKTLAKAKAGLPQFVPAEGVKFPIKLESKSTGAWKMAGGNGPRGECTGSKLKGEITGPKSLSVAVELEGCALTGQYVCHSEGLASGHMVVNGDGKLVYVAKVEKAVGTILTMPNFECPRGLRLTRGGAVVAIGPVDKKGGEIQIAAEGNGEGSMRIKEYENEKGEKKHEILEWENGSGWESADLEADSKLTSTSQFTIEA
jgi:hypothetical protein